MPRAPAGALGFCGISFGFSTSDLQAPVLGLTLERPPLFTPCRERFFPLPGLIRTRRLSGGPGRRTPTRADGNAGQAGAARRR